MMLFFYSWGSTSPDVIKHKRIKNILIVDEILSINNPLFCIPDQWYYEVLIKIGFNDL